MLINNYLLRIYTHNCTVHILDRETIITKTIVYREYCCDTVLCDFSGIIPLGEKRT